MCEIQNNFASSEYQIIYLLFSDVMNSGVCKKGEARNDYIVREVVQRIVIHLLAAWAAKFNKIC